ncbi:hypothetical protein [Burkholderia stagnalis]|uniref:hypothetical protein n=1 Tax=Burkholderia stagnalis TaxID=1503054 RepID=UPI0007600CF8|nr:hypothetical protein [Burkholderia stagnalis]KWN83017.1 hypothetical protein WT91_29675 [Burkholderia stagnalis]KWN96036.1 hypothetical protein WT92_16255 [Burkholderia stagnalis]
MDANQNGKTIEAATSACALVCGFDAVVSIVRDWNEGAVELYAYMAGVGELSAEVYDELQTPETEVNGTWAYEVDEACGMWLADYYKRTKTLPALASCRVKLKRLGRALLAR